MFVCDLIQHCGSVRDALYASRAFLGTMTMYNMITLYFYYQFFSLQGLCQKALPAEGCSW